MLKMKKILAVLLSAALFAGCVPFATAGAAETPRYLVLGDSIAEGYGILNSDEACYGRIVADTNGYEYDNYARVATDSSELLEQLGRSYVRSRIADADIISLSIGSNDYFDHPDVVKLVIKALFGLNRKQMDEIAEAFYQNLCGIVDTIYGLNPDVTLLVQTVYCVWYGFAGNANKACSDRCNAMIERYDKEHPGRIVICDISPAMNGHPENLADDCVHPNAAGNVAIARIVLKQLYDLGLGTGLEPVVNAEGVDWNFFETSMENKQIAALVTALVKIVTGNGANLHR
ncbi:MAG: SGNH/GDSL hydrolase family protein [Clostridia bacterium]|nr:SGNH/GDSL hydrolase family protein [Clostridia bacterium]